MTTQLSPKILTDVEARVQSQLPNVLDEHVHGLVVALFEEWADSKVQSFLPILVEREAVARLRRLVPPQAS